MAKSKGKKKKISIAQMAVNYAGDRTKGVGHGYPSFTADLIAKGFEEGYRRAKRKYNKK